MWVPVAVWQVRLRTAIGVLLCGLLDYWCAWSYGQKVAEAAGIRRRLWGMTCTHTHTHTHTHPFKGPLSRSTQVSRYQKGKTNLDFTEARDSESQWHQLGHMQVCTSLQTDNHASTPTTQVFQAGCRSCRPTNSVRALKALTCTQHLLNFSHLAVALTVLSPYLGNLVIPQ